MKLTIGSIASFLHLASGQSGFARRTAKAKDQQKAACKTS